MNPFDLRGPEFLLFYLLLALLTFAALGLWARFRGAPPKGVGLLRDAYLIAGLRGGENEVARLAIFSLLARGIATRVGRRDVQMKESGGPGASPESLHPVERAVIEALGRGPRSVARLGRDQAVVDAARRELKPLSRSGLLPGEEDEQARLLAGSVAGALLAAVAGVKLIVALTRGHSNVLFLIVVAGVCVWACVAWSRGRPRTRAGARALADLRALFGARRMRCPATPLVGSTKELVLTAAVAGIVGAPFARSAAARKGGEAGWWCGSGFSCGSGGTSSCGGSCGGGCGGCGS